MITRRAPSPRPLQGVIAVAAVGVALSLTGCGGDSAAGPAVGAPDPAASGGRIAVVTSTDVWGAVAQQVGGNRVSVKAFISDPAQDPHSYEANVQNRLAITQADLVIENGGGYDDFMDTLLAAGDKPQAKVLNAVTISGKRAASGGELNEHVWYDLPTVVKVANEVAGSLAAIDQAHAAEFRQNAATFAQSLRPVSQALATIKRQHSGAPVALTEPVAGYLLEAAGLVNKTPPDFSKAVEAGGDVAPAVLQQTINLMRDHRVKVLVYNDQTSGPTTEAVKSAATRAGVPVVPVSETLPDGKSFEQWMAANARALAAALDQAP